MTMKLSSCLSDLGITNASPFADCDGIHEEFKVIKKIYTQKILKDHPDKGGDAATFRTTRAAWQVLCDLHESGKVKNDTFTSYLVGFTSATGSDGNDYSEENEVDVSEEEWMDQDLADLYKKYSKNTSVPSYEYYEAAALEEVPGYKVELAKSGRSKCTKCGEKIERDGVRVGSLDKVTGTYGRWHHLDCWRVPTKVQNGLTNLLDEQVSLQDLLMMEEVLLTGVGALDEASKLLFVKHCVDGDHWAGSKKRKRKQIMAGKAVGDDNRSGAEATKSNEVAEGSNKSIIAGSFAVLVPGVDGALADDTLNGKTFVISGTFPEVGGGDADDVGGVANIKAMIESFGGKVISRFSKKTNFLLVGQNAVARKFKDARKRSVEIMNLRRLQDSLLGNISLHELTNFPALTSDMFVGQAYQPAGAPPPPPPKGQEMELLSSASCASPASKSAAVTKVPESKVAKKPRTTDRKEPAVPKVATSVVPGINAAAAAAPSSQVLVSRIPDSTNNDVTAVVPHEAKKAKFQIPRPGVNGAAGGVLDGKRFVLTGVFPEVGGGSGLSLGKDRAKSMIESFGGKVTGSVSGKTDYVLVGKDPGRSKVSKADSKGIPLINLISLQRLLLGQSTLEDVASEAPPRITNFSAGYPSQKRIAY